MSKYIIYTDGAYSFSRDQGGIGIVITKDNKEIFRFSKAFKGVTNNKMELAAVIAALYSVKEPLDSLIIRTDSQYVIGCATKGWKRRKNVKLWNKFDELLEAKRQLVPNIIFEWVAGHSDDVYNNICDELAVAASKEFMEES